MPDEPVITTSRHALVEAFRIWDAQAREEGWPDKPDPEASADHLISLLNSDAIAG